MCMWGAMLSAPLYHFWRADHGPLQTSLSGTFSQGSFLIDYMQTHKPPNGGLNVVHMVFLVSFNHLQLCTKLAFSKRQSWTTSQVNV